MVRRGHLPAQFARALAERLGFKSHVVLHRDEQVAQRRTFLVSNVLAMLEPAAGEEDRQVAHAVHELRHIALSATLLVGGYS